VTSGDQTPVPHLVHAFDLYVERCPAIDVGKVASGGRRVQIPVKGGTIDGAELSGVLIGGSETVLERGDGVAVVEANYLIEAEDGTAARAFGQGYRTESPDFAGTRLSLLFEADENGSLAHLARRAFLAEGKPEDTGFAVMRID
jgi:hypothetical protein